MCALASDPGGRATERASACPPSLPPRLSRHSRERRQTCCRSQHPPCRRHSSSSSSSIYASLSLRRRLLLSTAAPSSVSSSAPTPQHRKARATPQGPRSAWAVSSQDTRGRQASQSGGGGGLCLSHIGVWVEDELEVGEQDVHDETERHEDQHHRLTTTTSSSRSSPQPASAVCGWLPRHLLPPSLPLHHPETCNKKPPSMSASSSSRLHHKCPVRRASMSVKASNPGILPRARYPPTSSCLVERRTDGLTQ